MHFNQTLSQNIQHQVEISNFGKIFHSSVSIALFCYFIKKIKPLFYNKIKIENAARAYGLTDAELFQTIDLFEKRNIPQVTHCIYALGRHVSDRFVEVIIHSSLFSYLGTEKEIQRSNTWP